MSSKRPRLAIAAFVVELVVLLPACGPAPEGGGHAGRGGEGGDDTGGSSGSGGERGGHDAAPRPDAKTMPDAGGGSDDAAPMAMEDCTPQLPKSLFCDPLGDMPKTLKETGLFPGAPDLNKRSPSLYEYVPDPPLWSDGMEKQRLLLLPKGKQIDNTDRKKWAFPDGTIFIKTFFDDGGTGGKARAIETRFIRQNNGSYQFYVYKWNADGTDATLVVNDLDGIGGDLNADMAVPITIKRTVDGKPFSVNNGQTFMHTLPSYQACGGCHTENNNGGAQTFIGFDEMRLNSKLTPTSTKTQLEELADAKLFTAPIPSPAATITDNSNDGGRLLRIKRFVFGNCVHCHNGKSYFDLHPDMFVANTVGKPTNSQSVMPPKGWLRVVPGSPSTSVLYVQVQRTMLPPPMGTGSMMTRLRPMPPVGVADVAADQAALADLNAWILSLKP
jgi:hypothetical protein